MMKTTIAAAGKVESRTYVMRSSGRGDREVGPYDLTYTDTVYADGRIVWKVRGTCEGEWVEQGGTRDGGGADRL